MPTRTQNSSDLALRKKCPLRLELSKASAKFEMGGFFLSREGKVRSRLSTIHQDRRASKLVHQLICKKHNKMGVVSATCSYADLADSRGKCSCPGTCTCRSAAWRTLAQWEPRVFESWMQMVEQQA